MTDGAATEYASPARTAEEEAGLAAGTRQLREVAVREYRVVTRTRWTAGLTAIFAAFTVAVVLFAGSESGVGRVGALVVTVAELSAYLVPLAALALGFGVVVGADERGTLASLLALPVGRKRVLVGMFLGRAVAFASAAVVGLGAGGVVLAVLVSPSTVGLYLRYVLAAVGMGLAFLSVATLLSTVAPRSTWALGGALLAWAWFVLVYDLLALGVVVAFSPPDPVMTLLVLGNPVDLFRVLVLSGVRTTGGLTAALVTRVSPALAAAGLLAWVVAPLGLATALFERRRV